MPAWRVAPTFGCYLQRTVWLSQLVEQRGWGIQPGARGDQFDRQWEAIQTPADLGTLGGTFSLAIDVNDQGQVTGLANLPGDDSFHAFRWQNGVMTDLGTLGGPDSLGASIDDAGEVVGGANTSDPSGDGFGCLTPSVCRAFLWAKGGMTDLGTLGGGNSIASWQNRRHEIVGAAETTAVDPTTGLPASHAFVSRNGHLFDLGTLGGTSSFATEINTSGQVSGYAAIDDTIDPLFGVADYHAFFWQHGQMTDAGTLGGNLSNAQSINDGGELAGFSWLADNVDFHAFLWRNGVMSDLGTVAGDSESQAYFVSSSGQVLGSSGTLASLNHAFLWQNGVMTDLNTLIPAYSGWQLQAALAINPRGQIVGAGAIGGENHAFMLTPTTDGSAAPAVGSSANAATSRGRAQPHLSWRQPGLVRGSLR